MSLYIYIYKYSLFSFILFKYWGIFKKLNCIKTKEGSGCSGCAKTKGSYSSDSAKLEGSSSSDLLDLFFGLTFVSSRLS